MVEQQTKILIVDSKKEDYFLLQKELGKENYEFFLINDYENILNISKTHKIEIVMMAIKKGDDEIKWLKKIKEFDPRLEIIMILNNYDIEICVEAVKNGAHDCLTKPIDLEKFLKSIRSVSKKKNICKEVAKLDSKLYKKFEFQEMVGRNPLMLEIFSLIKRVAKHPTTVLITGETGTGKELTARAIHELSPRAKKRFVACNCSSLSETLLESELFGHIKGAFTGAANTKYGLFEFANEGTIFLDEIGEITPSLQTKLLRVLERKEIMRVGSTEMIPIDIRIIAATNRDLKTAIKQKEFREDLYYRLNVVNIHLPPLRERREDIPLLCKYFINKYNQKLGKNIRGISQPAQILILNYSWDGNIRELENIIERAISLTERDFISINDLPRDFLGAVTQKRDLISPEESVITVEELERRYILKILKQMDGNKSRTANMIGLSRRTLYRKLDEYEERSN